MNNTVHLDLDDILDLVRRLGVGPIRDLGLIDSAVARPRSSAFGEDAYPTVALKAAALLHSLAANHSLVDGNKRLAWLATTVFCDLNGVECSLDDDAAFALVWDIAAGLEHLPSIVDRLALRRLDGSRLD